MTNLGDVRNDNEPGLPGINSVDLTQLQALKVGVVIPARNAIDTLDRTIYSVRCQSHENLDIVVVDDASTDETVTLVGRHIDQDPRVRIVLNETCVGVGAARNRGARATGAAYLAFLDADDVMTADSVASRLAALVKSKAGMAYCWSAVIDEHDRIIDALPGAFHRGDVFRPLAGGNFIGNGSSILMTREAFEKTGGYTDALFKAGAQGCEDYKFYLDVARHFEVECVPLFKIGYRETSNNMSSNADRMLHSMELVYAELLRDFPDFVDLKAQVQNDLRLHIAMKAMRSFRLIKSAMLFGQIGRSLPRRLVRFVRRRYRNRRAGGVLKRGTLFPYAAPHRDQEAGAAGGSAA